MDTDERTMGVARGYAELGMWEESWDTLEELPARMRCHPEVLGTRLLVCGGLGKWELGRVVAANMASLENPPDGLFLTVGKWHLLDATAQAAAGDNAAARMAVIRMCAVWPEGKREALESESLAGIWG